MTAPVTFTVPNYYSDRPKPFLAISLSILYLPRKIKFTKELRVVFILLISNITYNITYSTTTCSTLYRHIISSLYMVL